MITVDDALAIDWYRSHEQPCGSGGSQTGGTTSGPGVGASLGRPVSREARSGDARVLISGRQYSAGSGSPPGYCIWGIDPCTGQGVRLQGPAMRPSTRLVYDPVGAQVCQIDLEQGLVPLSGGAALVPPHSILDVDVKVPRYQGKADVHVGRTSDCTSLWDLPLQDAAIDQTGDIYVVPVVVDYARGSGRVQFRAAARLRRAQGSLLLVQLYDAVDPNDNLVDTGTHEIELGPDGQVYVLNAHQENESTVLWVFDGDRGALVDVWPLVDRGAAKDPAMTDANDPNRTPALGAMTVSSQDGSIYLASNLREKDPNAPGFLSRVYRADRGSRRLEAISIPEVGYVTGISRGSSAGRLWVVGFVFTYMPSWQQINANEPSLYSLPFYEGYLAEVEGKTIRVRGLSELGCGPALPLSVLWKSP